MILTLTWKELREHRAIWLAMVVMTGLLGAGLARIVSPGDPAAANALAAITILTLAASYGAVCGAMMFAGEHEGGTLVFLDVFSGRRGRLWLGKFGIGVGLVLSEALAVALVLWLLKQTPPAWVLAVIGRGAGPGIRPAAAAAPDLGVWYLVVPVMTLEAYAWGLLGSSLARRVLSAAAIAALGAAGGLLFALCAPSPGLALFRLLAAGVAVVVSCAAFIGQPRDPSAGPLTLAEPPPDPRRRFLDLWEEPQREDDAEPTPGRPFPIAPVLVEPEPPEVAPIPTIPRVRPRRDEWPEPGSAGEVLWWLTVRQAWAMLGVMAAACLFVGLLVPAGGQVLWPLATLLVGVACGTATFAAEQRDQSYQLLAAQHLPLEKVWRFKLAVWFAAALLATVLIELGAVVVVAAGAMARVGARPGGPLPAVFEFGTLGELLGPVLFLGVWLVYGFGVAQLVVWYCRKTILALLLSALAAAGALALWLPSLLAGGINGWPVWVPPLVLLAASRLLVRAWAGGRIKERRPVAALAGLLLAAAAWIGLNYGHRAWQVPDVGPPLDPVAFRATIPSGPGNAAGPKLQEAFSAIEQAAGGDAWLKLVEDVPRLPVGVIETPHADGPPPTLHHLRASQTMTDRLRALATRKLAAGEPGPAFEHLALLLALSRNLRNKAPLESYLAGVAAEESALVGLDECLHGAKPTNELRRALDELNRHAAETPPPIDCLRTECLRSGGLLANPLAWSFASPGGGGRNAERWLAGGIALSLEMPWEAERKTRLWQLVWAGLFHAAETPWSEFPPPDGLGGADTTRKIVGAWRPPAEGPGASIPPGELARLVDSSWLSDRRLFPPAAPLRAAATRARWRVDASRLKVALALYQLDNGAPAATLDRLVPMYLPELPPDPYGGQLFRYRISPGERIDGIGDVLPGQGVVWSTGPDRVDHGGHRHGRRLEDDDAAWAGGGIDLVVVVPLLP